MKKIIILLLLLNFNFTNSFSIEADVFVQSTVNRAAETLGGGLTKEGRMDELKKIALDTVDIRGIGFYSLGSHRKNASDDQKIEYEEAFREYFLQSFSSRLAEYSNPIINVDSKNKINENIFIYSIDIFSICFLASSNVAVVSGVSSISCEFPDSTSVNIQCILPDSS